MVDLPPHPVITCRAMASVGLKRPVLLIHWLLCHTIHCNFYHIEVCKTAPDYVPKTLSEERGRKKKREVGQGQAI